MHEDKIRQLMRDENAARKARAQRAARARSLRLTLIRDAFAKVETTLSIADLPANKENQ